MERSDRFRDVMILAALWAGLPASSPPAAAADEPPPGVEQLLPRGRIAAIVDPRFVPAAAAELPDDAWVLGVVVDGRPKAYSLNLLNRHEVTSVPSTR